MADVVSLNVGGNIFQATRKTLEKSACDDIIRAISKKPVAEGSLFFDRNPHVFQAVLDYYRTGKLHVPSNVCGDLMRDELQFWGVFEREIAPCCWKALFSATDNIAALDEVSHFNGKPPSGVLSTRRKIWSFLDDASSSIAAKVWSYLYLLLTLLTFMTFCAQTSESFRLDVSRAQKAYISSLNITHPKLLMLLTSSFPKWVIYFNRFCYVFFAVEFSSRLVVCPNKVKFFKQPMNIMEPGIIVCTFSQWFIEVNYFRMFIEDVTHRAVFVALSAAAHLRLLYFFKLSAHLPGLKILVLAIKSSLRELLLLLASFCICVFVYASFVFACDFPERDSFPDMFVALWWTVVTMTTVGYGDYAPQSVCGRIVGCMCALTGLLILAMPVAVIANNFGTRYTIHRYKVCMEEKEEKKQVSVFTRVEKFKLDDGAVKY